MDDEEEDDDEEADDGIYHHSFEFAERPEECELMIRIGNIEHQKGIDMQKVLEWAYFLRVGRAHRNCASLLASAWWWEHEGQKIDTERNI